MVGQRRARRAARRRWFRGGRVTALESEVEQAFQRCWTTGSLDEDWARWPQHLTPDVRYVERFFGTMYGRDQVRAWIIGLMAARADVHAVLEWYIVKDRRVVLSMQNRYYAPDPDYPHLDFAGLTVLEYAGDGLFGYQEDYWDVPGSRVAADRFSSAVERFGGRGLEGGRYERLEAERRAQTLAVFARGG
ncbi:MAG: hypothetical protein NVS3B26_30110 [Mycobacteriales bacterium]